MVDALEVLGVFHLLSQVNVIYYTTLAMPTGLEAFKAVKRHSLVNILVNLMVSGNVLMAMHLRHVELVNKKICFFLDSCFFHKQLHSTSQFLKKKIMISTSMLLNNY